MAVGLVAAKLEGDCLFSRNSMQRILPAWLNPAVEHECYHQKLLVLEDKKIVGVLRLSDVFMKIFELMKQCEL